MPRKAASQWEFGELFEPRELRRILSVSELTGQVRQLLEQQIGTVWVGGEVTNLRVQASGHAYFNLKDPSAQVNCVLFRGSSTAALRTLLDNGARVIARGELTVYEPRGQYQLVIKELEFQGIGALQMAFEKLKRELEARGYFAQERKRALPRFPERIGLVTSPSGAAIKDVLHVISRRQPGLETILAPCRVQGQGAGEEIADAITRLNQWSQDNPSGMRLDLILVTRGGGSFEDLWAFNEPVVAEAIFHSELPVISAVGHEIDFTISDFVADVRAATPSAAAEIVTEDAVAGRKQIPRLLADLRRNILNRLRQSAEQHRELNRRLQCQVPSRQLHERMQYVDDLQARFQRAARMAVSTDCSRWENFLKRLAQIRPRRILRGYRERLASIHDKFSQQSAVKLAARKANLQRMTDRLRLLSPSQVLARGYSITLDAEGRIIRDERATKPGQKILTKLAKGSIHSRVE